MVSPFVNTEANAFQKKTKSPLDMMPYLLLQNGSVGMDAPLVDKEGYPRSDINIYAVREARNKVICRLMDDSYSTSLKYADVGLRNDHKKVMKLIEDKLYLLHADAREKGTVSVGGVSGGAHPMKEPFATVTMVTPGSPAALSVSTIVISRDLLYNVHYSCKCYVVGFVCW